MKRRSPSYNSSHYGTRTVSSDDEIGNGGGYNKSQQPPQAGKSFNNRSNNNNNNLCWSIPGMATSSVGFDISSNSSNSSPMNVPFPKSVQNNTTNPGCLPSWPFGASTSTSSSSAPFTSATLGPSNSSSIVSTPNNNNNNSNNNNQNLIRISASSVVGNIKVSLSSFSSSSSSSSSSSAIINSNSNSTNNNNNKNTETSRVQEPITIPVDPDALLISEWNQLSLKEREKVQDEIHGVANLENIDVMEQVNEEDNDEEAEEAEEEDDPDTPNDKEKSQQEALLSSSSSSLPNGGKSKPKKLNSKLQKALQDIKREVSLIRKKSAYDKALFLNPSHVMDDTFLLMFLRAEQYDPTRAAHKLVDFWELKLSLFGPNYLAKPNITIQDLPPDAQIALQTGSCQLPKTFDRSGRRILLFFQKYQAYNTGDLPDMQMSYYQIMLLCQDEEVQKKGVVIVVYNVDSGPIKVVPKNVPNGMQFVKSIPLKINAWHYCYNEPMIQRFMNITKYIIGTDSRLRFRSHFGSHMECQYALMTFGIITSQLPMDEKGGMDWSGHQNHLHDRLELEKRNKQQEEERNLANRICVLMDSVSNEKSDDSKSMKKSSNPHVNISTAAPTYQFLSTNIPYPNGCDVLLGRGRPNQEFQGNVRLAIIIDQHRAEYSSMKRGGKMVLCEKIVNIVSQSGGRFLKRSDDETTWEEVPLEIARDKVGHGFRTKTRRTSAASTTNDIGNNSVLANTIHHNGVMEISLGQQTVPNVHTLSREGQSMPMASLVGGGGFNLPMLIQQQKQPNPRAGFWNFGSAVPPGIQQFMNLQQATRKRPRLSPNKAVNNMP